MSKHAVIALRSVQGADSLISRSSLGTHGAQALSRRASPTVAASVAEQVLAASTTPPSKPASVSAYVRPENLPRPSGRLTKEDLDPLVQEASAGNPLAIQELLHMIGPVVMRYCRARLGGRDLSYLSADDVAQEACLAVLKALPDYQDRGGSFLYLVHAIAASKVADAYRAVSRERSDPTPELPKCPLIENGPEDRTLHLDLGARLGKLVSTLPRVQQEILALRIAVGLSAIETAEALGTSAGNVRVTQHRALTRLRGMVIQDEQF